MSEKRGSLEVGSREWLLEFLYIGNDRKFKELDKSWFVVYYKDFAPALIHVCRSKLWGIILEFALGSSLDRHERPSEDIRKFEQDIWQNLGFITYDIINCPCCRKKVPKRILKFFKLLELDHRT